MKFSHFWKAWLSTVIGAAIPVVTAIASELIKGKIVWEAVAPTVIPFVIFATTDFLKELKSEIDK